MNCIDAIEGAAKSVITEFFQIFNQNRLDDTEYARNVKAVIDSVDGFICKNREILSDPQMLKQVLYEFSRELWLKNLEKNRKAAIEPDGEHVAAETENDRYDEYYFDYIYNHGEYPR
jgi:hypothetical protein